MIRFLFAIGFFIALAIVGLIFFGNLGGNEEEAIDNSPIPPTSSEQPTKAPVDVARDETLAQARAIGVSEEQASAAVRYATEAVQTYGVDASSATHGAMLQLRLQVALSTHEGAQAYQEALGAGKSIEEALNIGVQASRSGAGTPPQPGDLIFSPSPLYK